MDDYSKMNAVLAGVAGVRCQLDRAAEVVRDGRQDGALNLLRDAASGIADVAEQVQHEQVCHIRTDYPPDMHR